MDYTANFNNGVSDDDASNVIVADAKKVVEVKYTFNSRVFMMMLTLLFLVQI
jgi:hypothetical protein